MTANEGCAPSGQSFVGMVMGVGDLSIRDPDDDLAPPSPTERPAQRGSVDAVADVARWIRRGDPHAVAQYPAVRRCSPVAGSVAVANDESFRCGAYERVKLLGIEIH
jgi:hypothetical protein